jgi:hypothetical protein
LETEYLIKVLRLRSERIFIGAQYVLSKPGGDPVH